MRGCRQPLGAGATTLHSRAGRIPSADWERLRRAVLDRDGRKCQRCGKPLGAGGEVHHVNQVPDDNREANLKAFCKFCHIAMHAPPVAPDVAAWSALVDSMARKGLR